jgi:hypothetical protein
MCTKPVWALTYEINEYDQDGEYFITLFKSFLAKILWLIS